MSDWQEYVDSIEVNAGSARLWTIGKEYVEGPMTIRFTCDVGQVWTYAKSSGKKCGPDGDLQAWLDNSLVPTAPVGALVCKIGGSSAERAAATSSVIFAVGSLCVIVIASGVTGPLFLSMNDSNSGFVDHEGSVKVKIERLV